MVLAVFIVALALAPGLYSAVVQTGDFPSLITIPVVVDGQEITIQTLPALIEPEIEAVPLPVPESAAANPCDACFSYMTELIELLADTTVIQPHPLPEAEVLPEIVPHPMPQVEVVPEVENLPEFGILPHPMPQVEALPGSDPEISILPHEMPQVEALPAEYLRV